MDVPVPDDRAPALTPFPTTCPHCGAMAKYEAWRTVEKGVHVYGSTTWECGWTYKRWKDEEFDLGVQHMAVTPCRRKP